MISPDLFATGVDYLLEGSVMDRCEWRYASTFGDLFYSDLDFTDDVCLLAKLLELLE